MFASSIYKLNELLSSAAVFWGWFKPQRLPALPWLVKAAARGLNRIVYSKKDDSLRKENTSLEAKRYRDRICTFNGILGMAIYKIKKKYVFDFLNPRFVLYFEKFVVVLSDMLRSWHSKRSSALNYLCYVVDLLQERTFDVDEPTTEGKLSGEKYTGLAMYPLGVKSYVWFTSILSVRPVVYSQQHGNITEPRRTLSMTTYILLFLKSTFVIKHWKWIWQKYLEKHPSALSVSD